MSADQEGIACRVFDALFGEPDTELVGLLDRGRFDADDAIAERFFEGCG